MTKSKILSGIFFKFSLYHFIHWRNSAFNSPTNFQTSHLIQTPLFQPYGVVSCLRDSILLWKCADLFCLLLCLWISYIIIKWYMDWFVANYRVLSVILLYYMKIYETFLGLYVTFCLVCVILSNITIWNCMELIYVTLFYRVLCILDYVTIFDCKEEVWFTSCICVLCMTNSFY